MSDNPNDSPILQFAKRLERDEGNGVPMWRHVWCIPADARSDKKKCYIKTEFPSMTAEEMVNGKPSKKEGSKYKHPGRGHLTLPGWLSANEEGADCAYRCVSIYAKRVPDLFVLDFDERSKCNSDNELFTELVDSGTPYTETAKGYHFWVYITDTPAFTNSIGIQKIIDPIAPDDEADTGKTGALDFLGRKHSSAFNPIEAEHHELRNPDGDILRYDWEYFSKEYLNVPKMMGATRGKRDHISKKEKQEAIAVSGDASSDGKLEIGLFREYLNRLSKEGNRRYGYDSWTQVGIICWNNFNGDDTGFTIWMQWTHQDPLYPKVDGQGQKHSYRNLSWMNTKWASFSERETPMTWKTLRGWANQDDPKLNIYQEVWDARGHDGLVDYMNEFIAFNNDTSEIIYLDPTDHSPGATPKFKKITDMKPVFECFQVKMLVGADDDDEGGGKKKTKKVNPFPYWMKASTRRNVCGVTFMPRNCPKNYFNMFNGFDIEKQDVADLCLEEATRECQGLLDHIRYIWCKGNAEYECFVLDWFAHILQRPEIKVGCLVCVKSKEGGGKGIVMDFMRKILGERLYRQVNDIKHITGDWNSVLEGALLINGDEVVWGGDIVKGNTLKGLITEPKVRITEKNRQMYEIPNTTAFLCCSNEARCMAAREGDRRSFGLELSDQWAGRQKTAEHKKYFCDISGTNNSSQGITMKKAEAFAKVLFERDLEMFNPANAPLTEFVSGQIMKNWHPVEKWWYKVLSVARLDIEDKHKKPTQIVVDDRNVNVPFDEDQLIYGEVSTEWGNGVKEVQHRIRKTQVPLRSCAYYANRQARQKIDRGESGSPNPESVWKKLCDDEGLDYKRVPIPMALLDIYPEPSHRSPSDTLQHRGRNTLFDKNWASMPLMVKKTKKGKPDEEFRDEEFDVCCGMPHEALQGEGHFPDILGKTNLDKKGHFTDESRVKHDWQMDMNDPYDCVMKRQKMVGRPSSSWNTGSEEEMLYHLAPEHYLRRGMEGAFSMEDQWKDLVITDQAKWEAYKEQWGSGVNEHNFHKGLCYDTWNDEQGDQLMLTEHIAKPLKWVYDKEWVFEKYQQSVGRGYGAQNVDYNDFYSRITDMLGGDHSDDTKTPRGLYSSARLRGAKSSDRRQYWRFVALDKARHKFQHWAGRLVKWEDSVFEEDETEDADFGY